MKIYSIIFLLTFTNIVAAWTSSKFFNAAYKNTVKTLAILPLIVNPITVQPTHAIDAFESATSAMFDKKEKTTIERSIDQLPPAAKKRKALALCKDSAVLKAAGYLTSASCTSDAIDGNYDRILQANAGVPVKQESRASISSDSAPRATSQQASSTAASAPSVAASIAAPVKLEKVTDLSDLPAPAKKRRALAACKKEGTRKFAKMGSESKCTERVLQGDVNALIEALEYGR